MLVPLRRTDKPSAVPWKVPPWTVESDDWIRIDRSLADDHPARTAAAIVALLDLGPLECTYAGVGSRPLPPASLLALVLYELDRGELSPARWAVHARENDPCKWLVFGLHPAPGTLYAFRDRLGPLLDGFNRQVLERAIAAGLTAAGRAAGDGTFVAALGSRHRLVNAATLARRLEQLEAASAADESGGPAADPPRPPEAPPPGAVDGPTPGGPEALSIAAPAPPPGPPPPEAGTDGPASGDRPAASGPPPGPTAATAPPPGPARPAWMAKTPAGRRRQRHRHRRAAAELHRRLGHHRKTRSKRPKARRRPDDRVLDLPQRARGRPGAGQVQGLPAAVRRPAGARPGFAADPRLRRRAQGQRRRLLRAAAGPGASPQRRRVEGGGGGLLLRRPGSTCGWPASGR